MSYGLRHGRKVFHLRRSGKQRWHLLRLRWVGFKINILTEQWSLNWLSMKESLQLSKKPEPSDNLPKKSSQSERRNLITKISAAHNQSSQPSLHQRNCFWNLPQDSSKALFFKLFGWEKMLFIFETMWLILNRDRHANFTRVVPMGNRKGDNAQMAYIEYLDK